MGSVVSLLNRGMLEYIHLGEGTVCEVLDSFPV